MLLKPKLPKPLGFRQGRNYTPSETVRCVLPEAPCREPDAFRRYEICRAHPVEVTLPLRWLKPATPLYNCRSPMRDITKLEIEKDLLLFYYSKIGKAAMKNDETSFYHKHHQMEHELLSIFC
jgi:hypothetical protein